MTPTGPGLLCVPGLGLDERDWQQTRRALDIPTVVATLPGYGIRPRHTDDLTPSALADRLLTEHVAEAAPGVVLVGHSASCQVVARAAACAPGLVRGLVLVGPTTDPRAGSWRGLVGRWLATARHEHPGQVPSLVRQYARTGPRHIVRTMDLARHDDIRAPLRDVACPVLVLRGRHDRICPRDWGEALALVPERGASTSLGSGAHMVPITHPDLVADALAEFVAGLDEV